MKDKIKNHLHGAWRVMFIFFFIAFFPTFEKVIYYFTPAEKVWTYESIEPEGIPMVGNLAEFRGKRVSQYTGEMIYKEKINCGDKLIAGSVSKPFPFVQGDTTGTGVVFTFGGDYIYKKPMSNCWLTSCQSFLYKGYSKTQCFESSKFNILERE